MTKILKFGSNSLINRSIVAFYIFGVWPRKNSTIIYTIIGYSFHIFFTAGWTTAKCIGTAMLEKRSELILLAPTSLYASMSTLRIFIVMFNFKEIKRSFEATTEFPLHNESECEYIRKKIKSFCRTSIAYVVFMFSALGSSLVTPAFEEERVLPALIWFPLDWKNNLVNYWLGYMFSFWGQLSLVVLNSFLPIFIWFLMAANALKLEIVGQRISKLGYQKIGEHRNLQSVSKYQKKSFWSIYRYIKEHKKIVMDINGIQETFSLTFLIQIFSSAICICSVTYLMASESPLNNVHNFVMYISLMAIYTYEIFLLMYYGNEITLASQQLMTSIYQSNWMDLSLKYRKISLIFMERLKKPQEMVIGKVFPLNLKSMTSGLVTEILFVVVMMTSTLEIDARNWLGARNWVIHATLAVLIYNTEKIITRTGSVYSGNRHVLKLGEIFQRIQHYI